MSLPSPAASRRPAYARNGAVRLAYETRGRADAEPVVLIAGHGYGRWSWDPVADDLAGDFRVVTLDNRGIGDSDVPTGPYTAAGMATDVVAVLDDAGMERAHVVGASLGGMIAQELAIDYPDRVERLVLVSTSCGGVDAHPMPDRSAALLRQVAELEPHEALRRLTANALAEPAPAPLLERLLQQRLAHPQDPDGWWAQAAAANAYDGGSRQSAIPAATLIIAGVRDAVVDPRNADVLAERIPEAHVARFPDAGHLLFWEQRERFVELVRSFLRSGWAGTPVCEERGLFS